MGPLDHAEAGAAAAQSVELHLEVSLPLQPSLHLAAQSVELHLEVSLPQQPSLHLVEVSLPLRYPELAHCESATALTQSRQNKNSWATVSVAQRSGQCGAGLAVVALSVGRHPPLGCPPQPHRTRMNDIKPKVEITKVEMEEKPKVEGEAEDLAWDFYGPMPPIIRQRARRNSLYDWWTKRSGWKPQKQGRPKKESRRVFRCSGESSEDGAEEEESAPPSSYHTASLGWDPQPTPLYAVCRGRGCRGCEKCESSEWSEEEESPYLEDHMLDPAYGMGFNDGYESGKNVTVYEAITILGKKAGLVNPLQHYPVLEETGCYPGEHLDLQLLHMKSDQQEREREEQEQPEPDEELKPPAEPAGDADYEKLDPPAEPAGDVDYEELEPPAEEKQSEEPADYPDCDPDRAAMYEDYTRLYEQDESDDYLDYYQEEEEEQYGYSSEEDRYSPLDQLSRSELYLYYEAQESDAD